MTDLTDTGWMLDIGPSFPHGEPMPTCSHCRQPIDGEWDRIDRGVLLGAGGLNSSLVRTDLDFHPGDSGCMGAWFQEHHPELVKVRAAA